MDKNVSPVPIDQEDRVRVLSPMDSKHWEIVQLVMAQFGPDCTTTYGALKNANVPPMTYYRAMRNPVVQELRLEQMRGTQAAVQHLVEKNWLPVVHNMLGIAANGDSRESVQAARLIKDIYKDLEDGLDPGARRSAGIESEAAQQVRAFLGNPAGKGLILRQTTTTQEIEVQNEVSDGNTIEHEPA